MPQTRFREETGKLHRFFSFGLILRTDSGHVWFLDVEQRRAEFLVGLRVRIKGEKSGRYLRVTSIVQADG
jgi:Protein of unknown function (DUF5818)